MSTVDIISLITLLTGHQTQHTCTEHLYVETNTPILFKNIVVSLIFSCTEKQLHWPRHYKTATQTAISE